MANDHIQPSERGPIPPRPDGPFSPAPRELTQRSPVSGAAPATSGPRENDSFREIVETVVFVVVLVLLLRTFLVEAFVIPTGSMATTLLGYHYVVTCPQCGHTFPINASREVEDGEKITGCRCENCGFHMDVNNGMVVQQP
jgi:hypothetical protein